MWRILLRWGGDHVLLTCVSGVTLFALGSFWSGALGARQICSVPAVLSPPTVDNMFNAQQELDLGEIEAEWLEKNYHVIHHEALTTHLNRIANRVLSEFPPNQNNVRIILIDTDDADSFSAGTGRIYITRKMVNMLRSDDELAGLLGHEMYHIAKHQNVIVVSQLFHELLGVNTVRDRQDMAEKYNRMLNSIGRNKNALRAAALRMQRQEESHQYEADRVALYAAAAAGFSPRAFVEFFDRVAQTKGSTGNFLTDFFGATTPGEKRLREIYKSLRQLPMPCREMAPTAVSTEFLTWQADVIAYPDVARR